MDFFELNLSLNVKSKGSFSVLDASHRLSGYNDYFVSAQICSRASFDHDHPFIYACKIRWVGQR